MRQLTLRLVVFDTDDTIYEVVEMNRVRKDGKRDLSTLELLLDKATDAMEQGRKPRIEFI